MNVRYQVLGIGELGGVINLNRLNIRREIVNFKTVLGDSIDSTNR